MTIDCSEHRANHWNNNTGDAIDIEAPGKTVILRGIDFTPAFLGGSALGVNISGAKTVIIEKCVIRSFFRGIYDHRAEAGTLIVQDTVIENNSPNSSTQGGINIVPAAGGSIRATLNRVTVAANSFGIAVDGSNSNGGINVTIKDSLMANNSQDGLVATTSAGGSPVGVALIDSASINNNIGVRSIGVNVTVRMTNSEVVGNGTGLSFISSGALLSGGGNTVQANGANGGFSGAYPLQ